MLVKKVPVGFANGFAPIDKPVVGVDHAIEQSERGGRERFSPQLSQVLAVRAGAIRIDQVAMFQARQKLSPGGQPRRMPVSGLDGAGDFLVVEFGGTKGFSTGNPVARFRRGPVSDLFPQPTALSTKERVLG